MSTKTLRKRIALVAVSALGFGLVSVVPASAAITAVATTHTDVTFGVVGQQILVPLNADASGTATATDALIFTPVVTSKPAGSTVAVGAYASTSFTAGLTLDGIEAPVVAAATSAATDSVATLSAGVLTLTNEASADLTNNPRIGSLSLVADVPGVYKITTTATAGAGDTDAVGGAGTVADVAHIVVRPNATPIAGTAGTLTTSWSCAVVTTAYGCSDGNDNNTLSVFMPAGVVSTSGHVKMQVLRSSDSADLAAGSVIDADVATSAATIDYTAAATSSVTPTTFEVNATPLSAGLYEFLLFEDTNLSGTWDSTERYTTTSLRIAGAAKAFTYSLSPSTAVAGDTVRVSVKYQDADGYQTVKPAADTLSWTWPAGVSGTTGLTGNQNQSIGQTGEYVRFAIVGAASATTAGANTITVTASDTTWAAYEKTATLTIREPSDGATLSYVATTAMKIASTLDTTLEVADATGTLQVDTAQTTVYFTATGTAASQVTVTVTPGATTATSRVSGNGVTLKTILADGTVTFPVTVTTPLSTDSYTVTLEAGATDLVYTVNYDQPGAAWTILPAAAFTAKNGSTNKITAVLKDVFGRVLADKAVTAVVGSRNPGTFSGKTDASGIFTVEITDASTSTVLLTDTVTLSYTYLDEDAAAASATGGSATITYSATGLVASTITVTPAATTDVTVDQVELVAGAPVGSTLVYTVTARASTGANTAVAGLVTLTGGADDKFLNGVNTCVLSTSTGQCTVTVYRQKTGYANITATGGGASGTATPVKWINATSAARNIAISAGPASTVSAGTSTISATVTDRWGNPVSGVGVTFAELGAGRISATTGTTNAAGIAAVDFTSNAGETGTNTVSATLTSPTAYSANAAGYVGSDAIAGVTAGNATISTTVTITKDTSTSTADALLALATALGTRDQASATVDAAAEATDAANAATDAANAAAEAADAATAAAQDASDAVAALSAQVSEAIAGLKKQLVSLTNLVIKIQKKVKA